MHPCSLVNPIIVLNLVKPVHTLNPFQDSDHQEDPRIRRGRVHLLRREQGRLRRKFWKPRNRRVHRKGPQRRPRVPQKDRRRARLPRHERPIHRSRHRIPGAGLRVLIERKAGFPHRQDPHDQGAIRIDPLEHALRGGERHRRLRPQGLEPARSVDPQISI